MDPLPNVYMLFLFVLISCGHMNHPCLCSVEENSGQMTKNKELTMQYCHGNPYSFGIVFPKLL